MLRLLLKAEALRRLAPCPSLEATVADFGPSNNAEASGAAVSPLGATNARGSAHVGMGPVRFLKMRVRLEVHQDISQVGEAVEQHVLDQVADAMARMNGLIGEHLDVDINKVFQARLSNPQ